MRIEDQLTYSASPAAVSSMLRDEAFVTARCESMGSTGITVEVQEAADGGFTVTSERRQSTDEVPQNLRRFAGDGLRIRQVDTWQPPTTAGARVGTVVVEVLGLPVRFEGSMSLEPAGPGCVQAVEGTLTAAIPLMGARVEQAVQPAVTGALRVEQRLGAEWLRGHPAP